MKRSEVKNTRFDPTPSNFQAIKESHYDLTEKFDLYYRNNDLKKLTTPAFPAAFFFQNSFSFLQDSFK